MGEFFKIHLTIFSVILLLAMTGYGPTAFAVVPDEEQDPPAVTDETDQDEADEETVEDKDTETDEEDEKVAEEAEKEPEVEEEVPPTPADEPAKPAEDAEADVKKKAEAEKEKKKEGWSAGLKAGLTTSMVHNKNLPGIDDGLSLTIGVIFDGDLKYIRGPHGWVNTLKIVHSQSKTATLKPFFKTADELNLRSFYEYSFDKYSRLMLFGGAQVIATLFPGHLVVANDVDILKLRTDGEVHTSRAKAQQPYEITPGLSPFSLKQLVGAGVTPSDDPFASLNIRLSMVAQETWARGYTVDNDPNTPELEIRQLQNFQQVGPQMNLSIGGEIKDRLKYSFAAELMFPIYTSIDTELSGFNLLNTDVEFKIGVEISKWASLNYVFTAKRQPMILDEWQILNNLVFTVTANIL